jgi:hypothetical protein
MLRTRLKRKAPDKQEIITNKSTVQSDIHKHLVLSIKMIYNVQIILRSLNNNKKFKLLNAYLQSCSRDCVYNHSGFTRQMVRESPLTQSTVFT